MDATSALVRENIEILIQAEKLINELNDELYTNIAVAPFQSGVGMHIRHILDFYKAFLSASEDRIDYDHRERSPDEECHRMNAIQTIAHIKSSLGSITDTDRIVWSKNDDGGCRSSGQAFSKSSIGRELQFLSSHTVHHFAMIAMILVQQGYTPPKNFGVAASTIIHWRESGRPNSV